MSDIHHDELGSSPASSPSFPPSSYPEEGGPKGFSEDASASVAEALRLLAECLNDEVEWSGEDLVELLETVFFGLGGTQNEDGLCVADSTTAADAASKKGRDE